jgi:hypothetical protein
VAIPAAPASAPVVSCRAPGPVPNPGGLIAQFSAITATAGCNAWAVGDDGLDPGRELVEHWNGRRWAIQHTPIHKGHLNGVSALSPADVWAVGESGGDAVFEHWDGKAWRRVPSPLWRRVTMNAITAISPTDVWAVGKVSAPGPGAPSRSLLIHWDGRTWRRIAPSPANAVDELVGVTGTSAVDVWVVGCGTNTGKEAAVILHWNGRRWQRVPNPRVPAKQRLSCLDSVSASSADDVWALVDVESFKRERNVVDELDHVVIEHWDGRRWQLMPDSGPGKADPWLVDIVAATPTRAWAVGYVDGRRDSEETVAERWNGRAWHVVKTPNPDGPAGDNELNAVAAAPSGAAWAVGFYRHSDISQRQYLLASQLR